jgi:hypothetical protein
MATTLRLMDDYVAISFERGELRRIARELQARRFEDAATRSFVDTIGLIVHAFWKEGTSSQSNWQDPD